MIWASGREFDRHVASCDRRYKELQDDLAEKHHENVAAIGSIYSLLWKTAFGVIVTLATVAGALTLNIIDKVHG